MAAAVVVPESAAGDEDVDGAVVVVVAHSNWSRATDRVGRARETAHAVVVEQAVRAGRARQEDVRTAIVVYIGERGIGTAVDNAVRIRKQRERAVEIVAIGAERPSAYEKQVEIAVVVEVDEQRVLGARHVAHPGGGGYIVEPFAFAIMQQITAAVGTDRKQVEPAVVVVVRERRDDCTGGPRERHVCADGPPGNARNCAEPPPPRRG